MHLGIHATFFDDFDGAEAARLHSSDALLLENLPEAPTPQVAAIFWIYSLPFFLDAELIDIGVWIREVVDVVKLETVI
jgi:hypothetical protein